MTLRKSLLALSFCLFAFNAFSAVASVDVTKEPVTITPEQAQQAKAMLNKLSTVDLSELTVKQAEELAGEPTERGASQHERTAKIGIGTQVQQVQV